MYPVYSTQVQTRTNTSCKYTTLRYVTNTCKYTTLRYVEGEQKTTSKCNTYYLHRISKLKNYVLFRAGSVPSASEVAKRIQKTTIMWPSIHCSQNVLHFFSKNKQVFPSWHHILVQVLLQDDKHYYNVMSTFLPQQLQPR